MKPVLVGSRALAYWLPEFTPRENADWDFIYDEQSAVVPLVEHSEFHTVHELNNGAICGFYAVDDGRTNQFINGVECAVMSLEGLALMKRSHLWRAYHFDKHITMYHKYLAKYAKWDDPKWCALLKQRIQMTKEVYPQRNPSLDQTNMDFFDDAVKKVFDHDWIHELVAYYDRPLFERLKTEDKFDKAWCEKDLWALLSSEDKNKCVAEEAHVIACERFMIPNNWDFAPRRAYFMAVNKVCTTLTSGWFRDHAIDNFPEVIRLFDQTKFDKVRKATT
jgi:hypothetical protein